MSIKLGITLYAFGGYYNTGEKSLEDLLVLSRDLGFEGIELVAAQMAEGYPFITDEWLTYFKGILKKYNLQLNSWSAYTDTLLRPDRDLTQSEVLFDARNDLIWAKKAGAHIVRSQPGIGGGVFRKMRDLAKKFETPLTFELHAPLYLEHPLVRELMEVIAEPASEGILGVVPDFSIFQFQPPVPAKRNFIRDGFDPQRLDRVIELLKQQAPHDEIQKAFSYSEVEKPMVKFMLHCYGSHSKLSDLDILIPYSKYIHGKFHYINENLVEESIPYETIIPRIQKLGYNGYIACEYEGHGLDLSIDPIEQLDRFRKMVSRLLEKA